MVLELCNSFLVSSGTAVQKEMWGSRADGAGALIRVGEKQGEREWRSLILEHFNFPHVTLKLSSHSEPQ